jgi:hypothetical protein
MIVALARKLLILLWRLATRFAAIPDERVKSTKGAFSD